MKTKVSQATSLKLDWLVGTIEKVEGLTYSERTNKLYGYDERKLMARYSPTTSWAQGGPIIERERISTTVDDSGVWIAFNHYNYADEKRFMRAGPTPLTAAMRCYVASRLGDEVEIPEELAC